MPTTQELFVEGAERGAETMGERQGLGMLAYGLERLLQERGHDFTHREIANFVHDHRVDPLWDAAAKPESFDLGLLARAVDSTYFGEAQPSWELRSVLEGRGATGLGGGYVYLRLDWVEKEVQQALKAKKVRRGTKRYAEFVRENAQKVYDAAVREAQRASESQKASVLRRLEELSKSRAEFAQNRTGMERGLAFRRAVLEATGTPPDPRGEAGAQSRRELYERGAAAYDSAINYLQQTAAELDAGAESLARETMDRSEILRPFAQSAALGLR